MYSAVKLSDMTSRSEKRGTTPLRGKFPRSLTKSLEKSLHIIHHTFNCQLCFLHFSLSQVVFGTLPAWNPCQPFPPASRMPQRVRQATGKFGSVRKAGCNSCYNRVKTLSLPHEAMASITNRIP